MVSVISRPASPIQSPTSAPSLIAESVIEETNTLILTSLSHVFFNEEILTALREHFESYGELYAWAPLKSFGRIIMVFWDADHAGRARIECDKMLLTDAEGNIIAPNLRLYRGTPTPIEQEPVTLPVPHTTKNFLISPPGSPPIGWEPIEEEAPNTEALAADLLAALQRLQVERRHPRGVDGIQVLMTPDDDEMDTSIDSDLSSKPPGLSVFLEDTDFVEPVIESPHTPENGEGMWEGEMMRGGIGRVKATVESMGLQMFPSSATPLLGTNLSSNLPPRVPTPRPPPTDN